ncbi:hypothetical protein K438DRAFT_1763278 [Mycena galopus ATCC 62051]|nr:hypothetical protein K438DRAFT_1763278 [Mycena galopus ATCC 62051]
MLRLALTWYTGKRWQEGVMCGFCTLRYVVLTAIHPSQTLLHIPVNLGIRRLAKVNPRETSVLAILCSSQKLVTSLFNLDYWLLGESNSTSTNATASALHLQSQAKHLSLWYRQHELGLDLADSSSIYLVSYCPVVACEEYGGSSVSLACGRDEARDLFSVTVLAGGSGLESALIRGRESSASPAAMVCSHSTHMASSIERTPTPFAICSLFLDQKISTGWKLILVGSAKVGLPFLRTTRSMLDSEQCSG